ncbi:hypothetical protein ABH922_000824 [Rhodococcus sp. 27YEA15]|uniref:hypothetical protein n=1 Tax=Rhodococcus sp. 27YEA15 TaxID=3156259 RepID=UPI003C7C6A1D
MRRHRPRTPRSDGAALQLLAEWRSHVQRTEDRVRRGNEPPASRWQDQSGPTGCPACDGEVRHDPRARLEALIRGGGRRAHRLAAEVARLDDRYRDVTVENGAPSALPWWNRRMPWR